LITANAALALGQGAHSVCIRQEGLAARLNHNEIIAKAIHFDKPVGHDASYRPVEAKMH
jgi:hypothetical protein